MSLNPPQDFRKTAGEHRRGLASARPAAADVLIGTIYYSTDTSNMERSNGTTWDSYPGIAASLIAEISWTPTLVSSGGGTPTYTTNTGKIIKIGNQVSGTFLIVLSGLGTLAAGTLSIAGLPYTASAANAIPFLAIFANLGTNQIYLYDVVNPSTTTLLLRNHAAAGTHNVTNLTVADITGTATLAGGFVYFT